MLGGLLTGTLGWSAVFLVTVPVSVAAVVLARRVLPDGAHGPRRRAVRRGRRRRHHRRRHRSRPRRPRCRAGHGWTSPSVLASLAAAAALMPLFIALERRTADPLVPLELFRSRVLSTGVALAVLGGAARASTFVLVALYLQQALAMAPQQAGLAMVPTSLTGFAVSLALLPRMLRALGPRRSLVVGLVVLAAGHLWLAYAPTEPAYLVAVLPGLLLVATGVALSFTPTTMVIASAVPEAHTGLASGLAGLRHPGRRGARHRRLHRHRHRRSGCAGPPPWRLRVRGRLHRRGRGRPRDRGARSHPHPELEAVRGLDKARRSCGLCTQRGPIPTSVDPSSHPPRS